jgi:class 3 adenylate cyclase
LVNRRPIAGRARLWSVTVLWLIVAGAELVAVTVLSVLLVRSQREVDQLKARLAGPRPGARMTAGRAVKAVVETATKVRHQGVGGVLASSIEDLTRWATEDRAEIARVALPNGTVTILFSDIENSTAMNEDLGDSRWVAVLKAHDAIVRRQVTEHGGHVVKAQGDGFMVVFGEPADAVRTAVHVQRALASGRGRGLRRAQIKVRIGAHVGKTVSRDGDYFGRNVAMAARVAEQARGGKILVSDEVRAALGEPDEFELEPCGEVELKGFAGIHALWSVAW